MKTRILLAIASPELGRVVEHLLRELPGMEVVGRAATAHDLGRDAARLAPDVIVTSVRLLRRQGELAALRRFVPGSKVIVITCDGEICERDTRAADASLEEEDLVRGLLPILHTLAPAERI
jgi:DNA-binding NarL/FixJ family response regulator